MDLACMEMKRKLDSYQQKVWENHVIIAAAILDPYQKGSMLDERTKKAAIAYIRSLLPSPPPTSSSTLPPSTPISSTTRQHWLKRVCRKKDVPAQSTLTPSDQLDAYVNETVKDEGDPCYIGGLVRGTLHILPLPPLYENSWQYVQPVLHPNVCSLPVELWSHTSMHVSQHKASKH